MECNKDDAKMAMDLAWRKVREKNYTGAKKFANKAQNLYPELDGLKQLLITVDVYISGENEINEEADWYGILGVDPLADDEAVKKQYRKLILMLHPDKNKFKDSEGAYNLVSEAFKVLSNKDKRYVYNFKRGVPEAPEIFTTKPSGIPPHPPSSNGVQIVRELVVSNARARTKPTGHMDPRASVSSAPKESSIFWTMCNECMIQYKYQRTCLNQTLICPHCRVAFVAAEKTPPSTVPRPVNLSSNRQSRSSKTQATFKNSYGTSSGREPAPSVNHGFHRETLSRRTGSNQNATNEAANVVQQAQNRLKRGFGESQERDAARGFTNSDLKNLKKPRTNNYPMFGQFARRWSNQIGLSKFSTPNPAKGNPETPNTIGSRHIQRMLLPCHITKAVVNKGKSDILMRLPKMVSEMVDELKTTEREKKKLKGTTKMTSKANEVETNNGSVTEVSNDADPDKSDEVNAIVVPDSDFHNFDLDRSENSFEDGQIWAAYDDDDGMPRFYARIQKVISSNPFKMRISWLNSKSCSEFSDMNWIDSGFAKTCGDFRTGRYESTDTLNAYSHKVNFTKGARGLLNILPQKGQVWALYRNWSPDWDKNTPDEVIHKYDMVEVIDDYTEDKPSLTVTLLLKAEGFRAVFRRSTDQNDVRKITKEEMFRFSHQVPHYILTGKEADNAPEGCLELDPAATPCELVSENTEAKESSSKMDMEKNEPVKEESTGPKEEMGMNLD